MTEFKYFYDMTGRLCVLRPVDKPYPVMGQWSTHYGGFYGEAVVKRPVDLANLQYESNPHHRHPDDPLYVKPPKKKGKKKNK